MFKQNPKAAVETMARNAYGLKARTKVEGKRADASFAAKYDVPVGSYVAVLSVDGNVVNVSSHRDWRKAYEGLKPALRQMIAEKAQERVQALS